MAAAKFGLFILVMLITLCQQIVFGTGYYGYRFNKPMKYQPMKIPYWGKYKHAKIQNHYPKMPQMNWYQHNNKYYQKAPYNFKRIPFTPMSSGMSSAKFVPYQVPSNMLQNTYRKTDFFPKRNPKYLWLDFPNPTPEKFSKDTKVNKDKPNHERYPVNTVVELPKDEKKVKIPPEINVVTLQPKIGIETADGFGFDLYPKPELKETVISKGNTPTGGTNDVITPGESLVDTVNSVPIQLNKLQPLITSPSDVTVDLGNLPGSDISGGSLQVSSSGFGDIGLGGNALGMVPGSAGLDSNLNGVGNLIGDLIGAGNVIGNSAGIGNIGSDAILIDNLHGNLAGIGNIGADVILMDNLQGVGGLQGATNLHGVDRGDSLTIVPDGLQTFSSGVDLGGTVNSVTPILDGRFGVIDSSSIESSDFPRSFDIDANVRARIDVERSIPTILSLNNQGSGGFSSIGFEPSNSGDSTDDTFGGSHQVDILVGSDSDRVRNIHQPLARPLSLMLTVEPFGPGPYGSCRAPARVVCGARQGWEHVVGMASWCEKNCVVYMYTSYCDDDRCECECT